MRLVIGDVHGCADELAQLLDTVNADQVCLVGDCFTKGPDPVGVWSLIRDRGLMVTLGNHDDRLIQALDLKEASQELDALQCVQRLEAADPAWSEAVRTWPLFHKMGDWTVVHAGLHPTAGVRLTDRRMALTMRRWPLERSDFPLWHGQYTAEERVCFGHDARRGLVRVERDGQPWLVGLDSGCVYGGALSGYLIDEDRIVQVKARRVHKPVD